MQQSGSLRLVVHERLFLPVLCMDSKEMDSQTPPESVHECYAACKWSLNGGWQSSSCGRCCCCNEGSLIIAAYCMLLTALPRSHIMPGSCRSAVTATSCNMFAPDRANVFQKGHCGTDRFTQLYAQVMRCRAEQEKQAPWWVLAQMIPPSPRRWQSRLEEHPQRWPWACPQESQSCGAERHQCATAC